MMKHSCMTDGLAENYTAGIEFKAKRANYMSFLVSIARRVRIKAYRTSRNGMLHNNESLVF